MKATVLLYTGSDMQIRESPYVVSFDLLTVLNYPITTKA
jgi:hypothetical protein